MAKLSCLHVRVINFLQLVVWINLIFHRGITSARLLAQHQQGDLPLVAQGNAATRTRQFIKSTGLCSLERGLCEEDIDCGLSLSCAELCNSKMCAEECKEKANTVSAKGVLGRFVDCTSRALRKEDSANEMRYAAAKGAAPSGPCPVPGWPTVLAYRVPSPLHTSEVRKSGFQGSQRDRCDDLTSAEHSCCGSNPWDADQKERDAFSKIICPCSSCSRMNIVHSKEKAEAIAITRATDKVLAVCRNARICVGGLTQTWRFRFFDVRPGYGPCRHWEGGSMASCHLQVLTDTRWIDNRWQVKVRASFGGSQWAFPVGGLLNLGHDFQQISMINFAGSSADDLAKQAHATEQQVLVVGRGMNDVQTYEISCAEVAEAYPLVNGPPQLPAYVERKTNAGARPALQDAGPLPASSETNGTGIKDQQDRNSSSPTGPTGPSQPTWPEEEDIYTHTAQELGDLVSLQSDGGGAKDKREMMSPFDSVMSNIIDFGNTLKLFRRAGTQE